MMLGIEAYGSDSDSDNNTPVPPQKLAPSKPQKRAPKKITIGLPNLPPHSNDNDDLEEAKPTAKKRRLENGAGSSGLLSMLPAPKQKNPTLPTPERVLGGGHKPGLVFNTGRTTPASVVQGDAEESEPKLDFSAADLENTTTSSTSFSFRPTSVARGKPNISLEEGDKKPITKAAPQEPVVNFFSLGTTSSTTKTTNAGISASSLLPSVSSAPEVPTFEVPEPTPTDQYPGYYQLPSGTWAAHDPAYYATFMKKWQREYDAHVRALEKGKVKGFESLDNAEIEDVDAQKEMDRARVQIKEREERKAITQGAGGAPAQPKMTINASKMSGIARSRHQLSTLLNEAYTNREALEEKIAEGRRNRKEAGNKYGF